MKKLRLGILGLSPGNGHPYSWAAICNGYDKQQMASCPFPVIPQYLAEQQFPFAQLKTAQVTHIWTQDKKVSRHVAGASFIPNIVSDPKAMIGEVDGILLARDDAQNHKKMALPFLQAGLPIYIDKPLALSVKEAKELFAAQTYAGQLFTCSALRFALELQLTKDQKSKLGVIKHVQATISKDWEKYAIHLIEPVLQLIDSTQPILEHQVLVSHDQRVVTLRWQDGVFTTFSTLGSLPTPITITVYGELGSQTLNFVDTFSAFKNALSAFVASIQNQKAAVDQAFVLKTIDVIERGLK